MTGRSHRHRVPTARPPSEAAGVVFLWGRGTIGTELHGYLKSIDAGIDHRDDVARKLAGDHGCPIDFARDAWAWRIDAADPQKIDELTRNDRAVMGWTTNNRERCAPSVALRNALNAVSKEEAPQIYGSIETRFAKAGHSHLESDPNQWIARDDRVVFFDFDRQEWRLGDYVGA